MRRMEEVLHGDQHEAIRSLRDEIKDTEQQRIHRIIQARNKHKEQQEHRTRSRTKKKQAQETKPKNKRQGRLYRTQGKSREYRQKQRISS